MRSGDADLADRLHRGQIACHPLVVAEIALGSLKNRTTVLGLLDGLPMLPVATPAEIRALIEGRRLRGRGIGYVDAALLAACLLAPGTQLWTRDRRLWVAADELGMVSGR